MKLVIDIDEELYTYMQSKSYDAHLDRRFDYQIRFAVRDATPLPKGHGRLIDADKVDIELYIYTRRKDGNYFALSECVKKVPIVIEANKEMDEYGM